MRTLLYLVFLAITTVTGYGQRAQRVMLAVHSDFIKSDNDGFFEKMQGGMEGSFYISRKFAVTTAVEWWTEEDVLVALGARFCPIDEGFIRLRGLPGKDISIGGGFAKPLSQRLRIEAMADFYFEGWIAIRGGMAYGFGRHP